MSKPQENWVKTPSDMARVTLAGTGRDALQSTTTVLHSGGRWWTMSMAVFHMTTNKKGQLIPELSRDVLWLNAPSKRHGKTSVPITGVFCPATFSLSPITEPVDTLEFFPDEYWDFTRPLTTFIVDQVRPDSNELAIVEMTHRRWHHSVPSVPDIPPTAMPKKSRLLTTAIALASVAGEYRPPFSERNETNEGQFVLTAYRQGDASRHLKTEELQLPFRSPEALRQVWDLHDKTTRGKKGLAREDRERIAVLTHRPANTVKEQLNHIYRLIRKGEWK
ncbi:MAG: hypothetical protein ACKOCE_03960 [Acidimicrobiia bacterium]